MKDYLSKMLNALTSAYSRKDYDNLRCGLSPETNIGKLFAVFAWGLNMVQEQAEKIKAWDNLDNAQGSVLDRYGANFGVRRDGTTDEFYRLEIRVKVMSQLSGGDDDTVINAAAELLGVAPSDIELEDDFPAKKKMMVNALAIPPERQKLIDQIAADLKRLLAAGVGFGMYLVYIFRHVIEVSYELEAWSYSMPPCNTLYCGTFPCRATLGWTTRSVIRASVRLDLPTYLTRFCGTYPEIATLGWLTHADIQLSSDVLHALADSEPCGDILCGTRPVDATVGWSELTSVLASASLETLAYLVRVCGTYPNTATLGWVMRAIAEAGFSLEDTQSDGKPCGIEPDTATLGQVLQSIAAVPGDASGRTFEPPVAGDEECGTIPSASTIAHRIEAAIRSNPALADVSVIPPFANTERAGVFPDKATFAFIVDGGADVSASAEGIKKTPARSGMTRSGTTPERTMTGGTAEAEAAISGSVDGVLVDAPYENTDCGTSPKTTGTGAQTASEATLACSAEGFTASAPLCNTKYCGQN